MAPPPPPTIAQLKLLGSKIASLAQPKRTEEFNGDDNEYVLHCVHACDGSTVAASLSNREIKLYDRAALGLKGTLTGHAGPITSLCWSPNSSPLLASSSEDRTVRIWDTRQQGRQAHALQQEEEALSCAIAAQTGLLAVGVGDRINFFDARKPSVRLGQYADAHTDLVTKVQFHPTQPAILASGSEDGLVCMYNTAVTQADEALATIINAECAVRDFVFFGGQGDGLAVLTGSEGASVWHWPSARRATAIDDIRQACRGWAATPQFAVQYHFDGQQQQLQGRNRLLLSTSDTRGRVTMLEVQPQGGLVPVAQLDGCGKGHKGLVRAVDMVGATLVTGGEDARLCLWSLEETAPPPPPPQPGSGSRPPPATPPTQAAGAHQHKRPKQHQQRGGGGAGGQRVGVRYKPY